MRNRNKVIDLICNQLRRLKTNEFQVRLREDFGTPEENTAELLQLVTEDFEIVRSRNDETNLFVGRFFGFVLLIESKLESLLTSIDPDVGSKMLGKKIDLFRRLIKELEKPEFGYDEDEMERYRELIEPLREIAKIRNHMAHDLRYTKFQLKDVVKLSKLVKKRKPSLYYGVTTAPRNMKPLIAVAAFGFIVSERTSILRQSLA